MLDSHDAIATRAARPVSASYRNFLGVVRAGAQHFRPALRTGLGSTPTRAEWMDVV